MKTVQEYSGIFPNLAEGDWEENPFQSFGNIWFERKEKTEMLDGRLVEFSIGLRVFPNSARFVARVFSLDLGISEMVDIAKLDGGEDYVPDLWHRAHAVFEDLFESVRQKWEKRKADWIAEDLLIEAKRQERQQ